MRSFVKNRDPSIGSTLVAAAGALGATVANTAAAATAAITTETVDGTDKAEEDVINGDGDVSGDERNENGSEGSRDQGGAVDGDGPDGPENGGYGSAEIGLKGKGKGKGSDEDVGKGIKVERATDRVNPGDEGRMDDQVFSSSRKFKGLTANTGKFHEVHDGHYDSRPAAARKAGPVSLHTSDFDGYEETETEGLGLGGYGVADDIVGDKGHGKFDGTYDNDGDHNENEDGNSNCDGDHDNNSNDDDVFGTNGNNATSVRNKDGDAVIYPKAELVEYYRQKELAEMHNGSGMDKTIVDKNYSNSGGRIVGSKLIDHTMEAHHNNFILPAWRAANLLQDKNGLEDGLLDSYPSTTVTDADDFDKGGSLRGM